MRGHVGEEEEEEEEGSWGRQADSSSKNRKVSGSSFEHQPLPQIAHTVYTVH